MKKSFENVNCCACVFAVCDENEADLAGTRGSFMLLHKF
jgi:hypothetical protein